VAAKTTAERTLAERPIEVSKRTLALASPCGLRPVLAHFVVEFDL
jgi:hypothetical protein